MLGACIHVLVLARVGFVHAILAEVMECVEDECAISRWDPGAKIGVISLPSGQKQPEATAW